MKIFKIIIVSFMFANIASSNVTDEIIQKLNETNNIVFNFEQKTSDQIEKGKCSLLFPGNLRCIYDGVEQKEVLIKNNNLYVIKHKFKRSYRYPIKNTAFSILLDKNKIFQNLKLVNISEVQETSFGYLYEVKKEGILIKIYFEKDTRLLKGWETISYNQETVKFNIVDPKVNIELKEKFNLPDYNF